MRFARVKRWLDDVRGCCAEPPEVVLVCIRARSRAPTQRRAPARKSRGGRQTLSQIARNPPTRNAESLGGRRRLASTSIDQAWGFVLLLLRRLPSHVDALCVGDEDGFDWTALGAGKRSRGERNGGSADKGSEKSGQRSSHPSKARFVFPRCRRCRFSQLPGRKLADAAGTETHWTSKASTQRPITIRVR